MTSDLPDASAETPAPSGAVDVPEERHVAQGDVIVAGGNVFVTIYRSFFASTPQKIVVLLFLTIGVALAVSIYWLTQQPWPLKGRFNIAVAEFRETKDGKAQVTDTSVWIGRSLASFLETELADFGLEVEVGHRNMPYIRDPRMAGRLAAQVQANLIIYGTFDRVGNQISLKPQFYVVPEVKTGQRQKADIEYDVDEIRRSHPFGLRLTLEPDDPDRFEKELEARAAVLSYFAQGLIRLHGNDLKSAVAAFEEASQEAEGLQSFEGLEALYLFTAVANRRLGDYEAASAALDRAFGVNKDYGRAIIALGNIYYSQAVDGREGMDGCLATGLDAETVRLCQENRHEEAWWHLLANTEATYRRAVEAKQQDYGFYLEEKGWLGLGNVRLLAAHQGEGLFGAYEQAIAAYRRVVDSYENTPDEAKRDLAALAYWGVGVASEYQGKAKDAREAYRTCIKVALYDLATKEECKSHLAALEARESAP